MRYAILLLLLTGCTIRQGDGPVPFVDWYWSPAAKHQRQMEAEQKAQDHYLRTNHVDQR